MKWTYLIVGAWLLVRPRISQFVSWGDFLAELAVIILGAVFVGIFFLVSSDEAAKKKEDQRKPRKYNRFTHVQEGYVKKGGTNIVPDIPRPPAPKGQGTSLKGE